ncbi:hypothetical protein OBBRIDRAFT_141251 [Obba rivulosa]|uniref:Uncharacterized protein n=1 Tax=Obba rivulosa TaxID=1052685 RepID=A0A8E2J4D6_9APHY|nr:hypothetical protein OBBRIDRAFT_141251 [Obba rivulosa]
MSDFSSMVCPRGKLDQGGATTYMTTLLPVRHNVSTMPMIGYRYRSAYQREGHLPIVLFRLSLLGTSAGILLACGTGMRWRFCYIIGHRGTMKTITFFPSHFFGSTAPGSEYFIFFSASSSLNRVLFIRSVLET